MSAAKFERMAKKLGLEVVKRETIQGVQVLYADGFTTKTPPQAGISGSAYMTMAAWGTGGEYHKAYQNFYKWNEQGGRHNEQPIRIAEMRDFVTRQIIPRERMIRKGHE